MRHCTPLRARRATACWLALVLIVLAAPLVGAFPPVARADTHIVTTADDSGSGSLGEAIANAASGDTITFAPEMAGQTITLTDGAFVLDKDLTIDGSALTSRIRISGGYLRRIFSVLSGATVTLIGLELIDGQAMDNGGAIDNEGALIIRDCVVRDNSASSGGGIYNYMGTLKITNSLVAHNMAATVGGGIYNEMGTIEVTDSTFFDNSAARGGGIFVNAETLSEAKSTLTVVNSTFYGNHAILSGGGVHSEGTMIPLGGPNKITVANSTFHGNYAHVGGAIDARPGIVLGGEVLEVTNSTFSENVGDEAAGIESQGTLHLANTIVANSLGGGVDLRIAALATNAANLIESCESLAAGGDCGIALSDVPEMEPPTDHGGPTFTIALGPGSPALNAADFSYCPLTDQRGVPRPQGADCDIGAFEVRVPAADAISATSVTATGATLQGTVTAHDFVATATFEYGLTNAYGSTVAADSVPVPAGMTETVSADLTGLLPNAPYHCRVVAANAAGTAYGADSTFTTLKIPPTATTGGATDVTSGSARLSATVNAQNDATTVHLEYGTDTNYDFGAVGVDPVSGLSDTPVTVTVRRLAPETTYHYRVVATNGAGTVYGEDRTFTTIPLPRATVLPPADVTPTGATLRASVNPQGDVITVTFEYGTDTHYDLGILPVETPLTGYEATVVTTTLTGLATNTTYHYRVITANTEDGAFGEDHTFTTAKTKPTATTGAATGVTTSGATLQATVNAQNDTTTVRFEYGTDTRYGQEVVGVPSSVSGVEATAVRATLTGLDPNTTYHYRVVATNGAGITYGADRTFTTAKLPPTATTGAATSITMSGATLHATVNAQNDATTVSFQYSTDASYDLGVVELPNPVTGLADTAVAATLSALAPDTTYHYRVVATNSAGTIHGADHTFTTRALPPELKKTYLPLTVR